MLGFRSIALTTACSLMLAGSLFVTQVAAQDNSSRNKAFLGLQIQGVNDTIKEALDLEGLGVLIRDISSMGPAFQAGLMRGDIIVEANGDGVDTVEDMAEIMAGLSAGDRIDLEVVRKGQRLDIAIPSMKTPAAWAMNRNRFGKILELDITMSSLTEKVRERFGLRWETRGVVVTLTAEEGEKAAIDLKPGDVITQVNQRQVWQPSHVLSAYKTAQKNEEDFVLLLVENTAGFRFVLVPVL